MFYVCVLILDNGQNKQPKHAVLLIYAKHGVMFDRNTFITALLSVLT